MNTVLPPIHVSPETAYIIEDYPFGFTLRCKKRVWLEYRKQLGFRMCSQTTNPKKKGMWNKPKYSNYQGLAGVLYLDGLDNNYLKWSGANYYMSATECRTYLNSFKEGLNTETIASVEKWIAAKEKYQPLH